VNPEAIFDQSLKPGVGIGPLRFGASRASVEASLGSPTAIEDEAIAGWILWDYPDLGCELAFDSEEDERLVSLRCDHTDLRVAGEQAIGLEREVLLALGEKLGLGPHQSESEGDDEQEIDFPDAGLMFSLRDGSVVAISAAALMDDADQYVWP
jgi:hypothetical protein